MKIHNRFKNPERWRQFVASLDSGGKWFERLKPDDRAETTSMTATAPLRRNSEQKGKTMNFASDSPLPAGTTISQQMHAIRVAFVKAMGIESQPMNPNPAGGYKLEHNYAIREANLAEACRLRDEYADMVKKNGVGQNILDKMDSNLENRDRGAVWR
jgi:hypothetical protein